SLPDRGRGLYPGPWGVCDLPGRFGRAPGSPRPSSGGDLLLSGNGASVPPPPLGSGAGACPAGGLAGVPLVQTAGPWLDPGGGSHGGPGSLVTGAARLDAEGA